MSSYEQQIQNAKGAIHNVRNFSDVVAGRGSDASAMAQMRIAGAGIAIAEAILALAEAVRPAPVEVKVEVDEERIVQSVRDAMDGSRP